MIFFVKKLGGLAAELQALKDVVQQLASLTGVHSGADVLFAAECAIYRGELTPAEPLCHQAFYLADEAGQWPIRAGAVNQLAQIAFKRSSNKELIYYIKGPEGSVGRDAVSPWVSQMLQADYYSWRGLTQLTAPWISSGKIPFPEAPDCVKVYLRYAHLAVLLQKKEYPRLLGAAKAALTRCQNSGYLMMQIYLHLLLAVGYIRTGQGGQARIHVLKALADAIPDRIYLPFMEFQGMLGNLIEKAFSALGVEMPEQINTTVKVFENDWKLQVQYAAEGSISSYGLTGRETEVATPAAKGLSNKEIAAQFCIAEATVRYHLRSVFSKLGIDRCGKLSGLLNEGHRK